MRPARSRSVCGGLEMAEEESAKIEGEKLFRVLSGYDRVMAWLADGITPGAVRLRRVVTRVRWESGKVSVEARPVAGGEVETIAAKAAVITLPLGLWQAEAGAEGAVEFAPELKEKRAAAGKLVMGSVVKVLLRFREAFWEARVAPGGDESLEKMSFMHSGESAIPTLWSFLPVRAPLLMGWAGGPAGEALDGKSDQEILRIATEALARMFGMDVEEVRREVEGYRVVDWKMDPYARGAYSYVAVGGLDAMEMLARPIEKTLFFAGEATHYQGMSGTVSGAIETGERAAREVIERF